MSPDTFVDDFVTGEEPTLKDTTEGGWFRRALAEDHQRNVKPKEYPEPVPVEPDYID